MSDAERTVEGSFDEIDTFSARFGPPRLTGVGSDRRMLVPVVNLGLSDHPLQPGGAVRYVDRAVLVFDGVRSASRRVFDYDASGQPGKIPRAVVDAPDDGGPGDAFRLEGLEASLPLRYSTDWNIRAARFTLRVPGAAQLHDEPVALSDDLRRFLSEDQ